jgi:hypothetical protein
MVVAEVLVRPGVLTDGRTKAFVPVTTWADSVDCARRKLSDYLDSFKWHLVSIEDAHPIEENRQYSEEVADMIERTRNNPDAIILGRFFTYREN